LKWLKRLSKAEFGIAVLQVEIHVSQDLLHMLYVSRRIVQMTFTQSEIGSQCSNLPNGAETGV
jgi:hypothetical protein